MKPMSDDIVSRLRRAADEFCDGPYATNDPDLQHDLLLHEAVGAILALRADNERLRAENALLASYLYPVGMMLNPDAMTLRPTTLFDDGIDGVTAEEVEEFLDDDRG
jgi:hypothetical protein